MKSLGFFGAVSLIFAFFMTGLTAQDTPQYVGANKCRACHMSKKKGDQFNKWKDSRHAVAFATLATDKAKEVAVAAGVSGDPQKADACLQCHVTAHGADAAKLDATYSLEEGVSCEHCHGPGSLYRKATVMNAKKFAADPAGTRANWKTLGLVTPDEALCKTCHNDKSPTFKGFDFTTYYEKIAHPNPSIQK